MVVDDGKRMRLRDVEDVLAILSGYGQKEQGGTTTTFDRYSVYSAEWQDMTARTRFLDAEGFDSQIIYSTPGIIRAGELSDPELAAALCRAYNRWAFDLVEGHRATVLRAHFDSGTCARCRGTSARRQTRMPHRLYCRDADRGEELRPSGL